MRMHGSMFGSQSGGFVVVVDTHMYFNRGIGGGFTMSKCVDASSSYLCVRITGILKKLLHHDIISVMPDSAR